MRSGLFALLFLCGCAAQSSSPALLHNTPPTGFTALFNGEDLGGWHGMGHFDPRKLWAMNDEERATKRATDLEDMKKHWTVENGELINDGHGVYLTTDKDYGDFELLIDYKTVAQADSGIYLRGCPQVQIWDWTKEGGKWHLDSDKGSGGLWNNNPDAAGKNPLVRADKPFGEWNRFRILVIGERVTVHLNDQLVVADAVMDNFWDRSAPLFSRGPIQLQTHGGEIRWRNIFIREIEVPEIRDHLSRERFRRIDNGQDLTGWAGSLNSYEVVGGAIQCKKGQGGFVWFDEEVADFVVRLEFRLPPGGNNGLAIRYPGWILNENKDGRVMPDAAYHGMCELQVLDNSSEKYKDLDPRQYHGSAYGMVAAKRGFQRPVGEWNYQQITVIGSRIKVELNGTTILDADLGQVTEFMGNPVKGKDRPAGFFGFAGHGDPVQFRNIQLLRL